MAPKLAEAERERIVASLKEGKSQGQTARDAGRHVSTVNRIAKAEGIESNVAEVKKVTEARKAYAEERRLELIGRGFDKASTLLEAIADSSEFQKWTVGFGTLIDKARLETGEATSRTENVDPARRERIKQSLDEVAERRRMAGRS